MGTSQHRARAADRATGRAPARQQEREVAPAPDLEGPLLPEAALELQGSLGNAGVQDLIGGQRASTPPPAGEPAPMRFPHNAAIERATGIPMTGGAVLDPEACDAAGVQAFSESDTVHFAAGAPPLGVAAHEAAHLLQHSGATGTAGLNPELHAEAVAEAVEGGRAPDPRLLSPEGPRVAPGRKPYTEIDAATQQATGEWDVGSKARVGDAGLTVTTEMQHECWADPALVAQANTILQANQSGVEITTGSATVTGTAPDGSGPKTLHDVVPTILSSTTATGDQELWADCGRSSREVMGPTGTDTSPRGIYGDGAGTTHETPTSSKNPATFRDEIFVAAGLGATPDAARQAYFALSDADRDAFDQAHGINRYAAPGVGEAFVARRHDEALQPGDATGFNFHWAGVIMVAGGDRVTFENFAKPGTTYDSKDTKWYFETYGPPTKAGQTFHDQNQGSVGGDVSDDNVTMAATTADHAAVATRLTTRQLLERLGTTDREEQKTAYEAELATRNIAVGVTSTAGDEWGDDEVYIEVHGGSGDHRTATVDLPDGAHHRFLIPLARLVPLTGDLTFRVREEDLLFDDDLVEVVWSSPWTATSGSGEACDVTVDFER